MSVTHSKVSAKSDPADTTLVRPSDWNAAHTIADGTITAAMMAVPPPYTVYVAPGGAAGDIQAAIDGMPVGGGVIQLGYGTYTPTSLVFPTSSRGITIVGRGGITAGADAASVISFTAAGSGSFIQMPLTQAHGFRDLEIKYTNTAFTGTLFDCANGTYADNDFAFLEHCLIWGARNGSQTATLIDLTQTVGARISFCEINGGGIGIKGGRSVAVTGVSVANPTVITAPGHGFLNGASVRFGGLTTTPSFGSGPTGTYTITYIDANSFSIPVNVSVVTGGTGWCNNTLVDAENSNPVLIESCWFGNQDIMPLRDAGQVWTVLNCFFAPRNGGDPGIYSHTPGFWGSAVAFIGNWAGDITTTNAGSFVTWAGTGLTMLSNRFGGRQVSQIAMLTLDENGCDGYVVAGNYFSNAYSGIDFGSTTGHKHGVFQANAFPVAHASIVRLRGTIPLGIGVYDGQAGTAPDSFDLTGGSTASVLRFDGDTATQIYRSSAGIMGMDSELRMAGNLYTGFNKLTSTHIWGNATDTNAGMAAAGTQTNVDIHVTPKGTGVVLLNWPGAATGAVRTVGQVQLQTTIAPTQLTANTDNWNPTNLAHCREIQVDIDAARTLTGIVAQTAGTEIVLSNKTAFDLTLAHDATSTAANRFWCPGATNFTLRQKGAVLIRYNGTSSRWVVVAA